MFDEAVRGPAIGGTLRDSARARPRAPVEPFPTPDQTHTPRGHGRASDCGLAGRYVVDREIGAGGMATVYLARDVRHDRKVALKVLNPELGAVLGVVAF